MKQIHVYSRILLSITLFWPMLAFSADIYRYVDKNGAVHFSDQPPNTPPRASSRSRKSPDPLLTPKSVGGSSLIRIYKYVDSKGNVHLADKKLDARYKLIYSGNAPEMPFSLSEPPSLGAGSGNAAEYDGLIRRVARQTGIESALLHAIIRAESAYNPAATSPKGAAGLMQLMPGTAKRYGVYDRYDPASNVSGGARYLKDLLKDFDNNVRLALAAYNAGENAVKRHGNKIPPYKETRSYVKRVIKFYQQYRKSPPG